MKMTKESNTSPRTTITSGTREWADHNVNCIKGCHNNCRYCYAKMMAKRFGRSTEDKWKNMTIREDVLRKRFKRYTGRVMFPSSHDIVDISPYKEACYTVLGRLIESGNQLLVTTKPKPNVIQDIDRLFSAHKEQIQFRFTITSQSEDQLRFWEPNAPSFKERLTSLTYAHRREYKTSVSIEPFLDYDPTQLVEILEPSVTESIWIGRMNYIPRNNLSQEELTRYEEIRKNYETSRLSTLYNSLNQRPLVKFKDSIRNQLGL